MSTAPAAPHPTPVRFFDALSGYQISFMLKTAVELDVFSAIGDGANTTRLLSQKLQASERGIRILCDALSAQGFLLKSPVETAPSTYSLPPDSALFLDRNSPAYVGSAAMFLVSNDMVRAFEDLTTAVRTGTTSLPGQGNVDTEDPVWVDFAHGMANLMFPAAQEIAGRIVPETGPSPEAVLDIAAGHGIFGISIAKHHPSARITACDWAPVLAVAEANAARLGVADRFSRCPGDALALDFGNEQYDTILVTNFLHHFSAEVNTEFMKKVRAALKPGGRTIVLEFVPNPDRVSPPHSAHFPLVMLASTPSGDAYTASEFETMFNAAGFSRTIHRNLQSSPESVLVAWR